MDEGTARKAVGHGDVIREFDSRRLRQIWDKIEKRSKPKKKKNRMPRIDELWAWVAEDGGPDDEGIIATLSPTVGWMPLVGADKARIQSLRSVAEKAAFMSGKKLKLLRFAVREEIDVNTI